MLRTLANAGCSDSFRPSSSPAQGVALRPQTRRRVTLKVSTDQRDAVFRGISMYNPEALVVIGPTSATLTLNTSFRTAAK